MSDEINFPPNGFSEQEDMWMRAERAERESRESLCELKKIKRLIRIADGGIKGIGKRKVTQKKYIFFGPAINYEIEYEKYAGLEDQLNAIQELGKSKSHIALEYLRKLNETERRGYTKGGAVGYSDTISISYPNTKGKLNSALYNYQSAPMDPDGKNIEADKRALSIVQGALSRLEREVGEIG